MKNFSIMLVVAVLLSACSALGPSPQVVYHRPDIKTPVNKVILFPTTDFTGQVSEGAKSVDNLLASSWGDTYGTTKIIPAGAVIAKLTEGSGKATYMKIVETLDNISLVEQLSKNKKVKKFISQVTSKLGNYNFGLALISGGGKEYDAKKPIHLNIGMFDTENLTWKWITKVEVTKGMIGNWTAASGSMVSNSFDTVKDLEKL